MVTRNKLLSTSAVIGSLIWSATAGAYEIQMNTAKMQAMDKITGKVSVIEVPVNGEVKFGSFSIVVRACKATPPEETPENYAFVDVADTTKDGKLYNIFKGWMMSSSPALNAVEHPIYDVWLLECLTKTVNNKDLLSAEELGNREGLPKREEIQADTAPSKEAIMAAEAQAEAKVKQIEETPAENTVSKAEDDSLSEKMPATSASSTETLPVVPEITENSSVEIINSPAAAVETEVDQPAEKQEKADNAPVSLLPMTNENSTSDGTPQALINLPETTPPASQTMPADTAASVTRETPDNSEQENAPVVIDSSTIEVVAPITEATSEKPQKLPDNIETSSAAVSETPLEVPTVNPLKPEDVLPVIDEEVVEEDQFIDSDTAADLETELKNMQQ